MDLCSSQKIKLGLDGHEKSDTTETGRDVEIKDAAYYQT